MCCACAPPSGRTGLTAAITFWPGCRRDTPGPTDSMTPAASIPGTIFEVILGQPGSRTLRSAGLTAAAFTPTRTAPAAGARTVRATYSMISGPPRALYVAALLVSGRFDDWSDIRRLR